MKKVLLFVLITCLTIVFSEAVFAEEGAVEIATEADAEVVEAVEEECKRIGHGLTLNDLIYNDPKGQYRALFNLFSLHEWSSNFVYEGTDQFKESLWD